MGILQAVTTTVLVDIALVGLHFINPTLISVSSAITLHKADTAALQGRGHAEGGGEEHQAHRVVDGHHQQVTAYLVAGLLLGPYCIGALGLGGLGFGTAEAVASLDIMSQVALGFIAFTIGNEFRLDQLKQPRFMGFRIGLRERPQFHTEKL